MSPTKPLDPGRAVVAEVVVCICVDGIPEPAWDPSDPHGMTDYRQLCLFRDTIERWFCDEFSAFTATAPHMFGGYAFRVEFKSLAEAGRRVPVIRRKIEHVVEQLQALARGDYDEYL